MKITVHSAKETKKLAKELVQTLRQAQGIKDKNKHALVIALHGNLGAGKTTFVQGFLRGLGVKSKITSPTFVIAKSYKLKSISYAIAYHIDCYRIKKPAELILLGIKEIFSEPKNIVLIEWPERIKKIIPKNAVKINFFHGKKENERQINVFNRFDK